MRTITLILSLVLACIFLPAHASVGATFTMKLKHHEYYAGLKQVAIHGDQSPFPSDINQGLTLQKQNDSTFQINMQFADDLRGETVYYFYTWVAANNKRFYQRFRHTIKLPNTGNSSTLDTFNIPGTPNHETQNFIFYAPDESPASLQELGDTLENNYQRITSDMGDMDLGYKIMVRVYPDLSTYHYAIGRAGSPDWMVGNAVDSAFIHMVSAENPGPVHNKASMLKVIIHEFTHNCVSALAEGNWVHVWLNEGMATYMARQWVTKPQLQSLYDALGRCRTLTELEQDFAANGGYQWSETIVRYILHAFNGDSLNKFIQSPYNYSIVGAKDKGEFENDWHDFLMGNYINVPDDVSTTFQVDMSKYTGSFDKVYLNGNFNDWCGTCDEMTDPDNDSIYTMTKNIQDGSALEWLFTLDEWQDVEGFKGGESCTKTSGSYINRFHVLDGPTTLPAYYWNSCEVSSNSTGMQAHDNTFSLFPNPTNDKVFIRMNQVGKAKVALLDIEGRMIREYQGPAENQYVFNVQTLTPGVYFVKVFTQHGVFVKRLIVR